MTRHYTQTFATFHRNAIFQNRAMYRDFPKSRLTTVHFIQWRNLMEQKNPRNPKQPEDDDKHKSAYELLERQRAAKEKEATDVQSKAYELLERQRAERAAAEAAAAEKAAAEAAAAEAAEKKAAEQAPAASPFIATHTVVSGDTLSGIAQKYYGSAARDKWMAIYEANKEIIGSNPGMIRVGQVFQIPRLD